MMSDNISRKAAKDAIAEKVFHDLTDEFYGVMQVLDELPSTDRKGQWDIEPIESVWGKGYKLTCSECGECFTVTEHSLPNEKFCRGCGADMRGADDESTI